jgi:hypothetical protein
MMHGRMKTSNLSEKMICDQLTMVTQNVQGLGHYSIGIKKRRELVDMLSKLNPKPDVVLLKSTNLSMRNAVTRLAN